MHYDFSIRELGLLVLHFVVEAVAAFALGFKMGRWGGILQKFGKSVGGHG